MKFKKHKVFEYYVKNNQLEKEILPHIEMVKIEMVWVNLNFGNVSYYK